MTNTAIWNGKKRRRILSKRAFTKEEAKTATDVLFQRLSTEIECRDYWLDRINKPLLQIDNFILMVGGFKTPKEYIQYADDQIDWIKWKLYEDYGRYIKVRNTIY